MLRDYVTLVGYNVVFKPWGYNVDESVILGNGNCLFMKLIVKTFLFSLQPTKARCNGIPPEPDLWVVLKEENVKEDKDRPKVSTFWKYGVVFNLVREVCIVALVLPYYVLQINYLTWEWKLPNCSAS